MKHYNYIEKILDWAEERNLLTQGDVFMQLEKSREENSELTKAITKYEKGNAQAYDEIKDAIGDVYVTLVVAQKFTAYRFMKFSKALSLANMIFPVGNTTQTH